MPEGLGIRGILFRGPFRRLESMGDLHSPMVMEQCIPFTTFGLAVVVVERTGSSGML